MSASSSSMTSTAAAMTNGYEESNDFGYMPHYQHYAAILEAGGLKLSSPEQRYLISLIHRETCTTPKTAIQAASRRSSKHSIVHLASSRPKPVTTKRDEGSRFCGLRTTCQEEDLLLSLLGDHDIETDQRRDSSTQFPRSECSSKDALFPKTRHDPDPISSEHAAIVIPFSTNEEDQKPYFTDKARV